MVKEVSQTQAQTFSTRLHALRKEQDLSQAQVAQAAGIAVLTYRKLEQGESNPGKPANPRLSTLAALSKALGTTVGYLAGEG